MSQTPHTYPPQAPDPIAAHVERTVQAEIVKIQQQYAQLREAEQQEKAQREAAFREELAQRELAFNAERERIAAEQARQYEAMRAEAARVTAAYQAEIDNLRSQLAATEIHEDEDALRRLAQLVVRGFTGIM
ncbi:hypothetical protein GLOTRDRAFT_128120 [Gloeophyllum trabeum ATCC 11539]|uniref:Uncharacterized protein n=1 Tax=Gloeophyllum trabeum (strain ATCC 11539 / FP-39264 / Madison 617) TaxID=670483 RepID=S7RSW2_GLOTA|nr:uncharacterized protein GLOTRDRAFT_128120 [Gloeophyllum trabeum ATCC 11539]EPQ56169.1 hypothetical protein GLOTRDRAFT_128120 [Gloeophyllum trabeum ATCC 11539]